MGAKRKGILSLIIVILLFTFLAGGCVDTAVPSKGLLLDASELPDLSGQGGERLFYEGETWILLSIPSGASTDEKLGDYLESNGYAVDSQSGFVHGIGSLRDYKNVYISLYSTVNDVKYSNLNQKIELAGRTVYYAAVGFYAMPVIENQVYLFALARI